MGPGRDLMTGTAFEHASEAAYVMDPHTDRILDANEAGCALLGYARDELLATPISRIHPAELAELADLLERVLRDGRASTIKLTCRTKHGAFLPTEISLHAIEIGDRNPHPRTGARPQRTPATADIPRSDPTHPADARSTQMVTTGLVVRLDTKAGKEDDVAAFLRDALPLVEAEPGTVAWFALRLGASSCAIVDVFPTRRRARRTSTDPSPPR
jgi:PAS domain S-box-containing protein